MNDDVIFDIDDDEDMPAELAAVAKAITEMLGGSASDYAIKQLGADQFAMIFKGDNVDINDVIEQISEMQGVTSVNALPVNRDFANIHAEHGTLQ